METINTDLSGNQTTESYRLARTEVISNAWVFMRLGLRCTLRAKSGVRIPNMLNNSFH